MTTCSTAGISCTTETGARVEIAPTPNIDCRVGRNHGIMMVKSKYMKNIRRCPQKSRLV